MPAKRGRRGRVVVLGIMGRTPFAGVAWQALHYLEGLRRLGFEVFYVEDTDDWPYDAARNTITDDARYTTQYIGRMMAWVAMADRWAYRSPVNGADLGPLAPRLPWLFREAAALINLTGSTVLRDEYRPVPVRIYLETDPVLPQIQVARDDQYMIDLLAAHTHHFTFGENLGQPDCGVPVGRFAYRATRQPIVLDWWEADGPAPAGAAYTTVASWKQSGKDIEWQGETYSWSKHHEFVKFMDVPRRSGEPFELALAGGDAGAIGQLERHGWTTRDAVGLSRDILPYRDYVRGSRGEFTVAKDQNIRLRSGWFSDRSACYLAAGRPVLTQETGFSKHLPTGKGLFAFTTMSDVLAALTLIADDYEGHCRAAREIAADHFAAEAVLGELCRQADL
jgi:hypothetical protein